MQHGKRILLTGATGLIGTKLFPLLCERGYEVVICSRHPEQARAKLPGAAAYLHWEPAETGPWAAAIDGIHAIIHLAGAPITQGLLGVRWTPAYKAEIRNSRVVGTRGLVNAIAAAAQRPAVLISASAVGYYGYGDATPLDETAPPGDDFVAQICVAWEQEALRAETLGVRVVRLRTGIVLDSQSGALAQLQVPFRMHVGGPIMPGTQYYSWIHPADELGLLLLALEDERTHGPINATAPTPQSNRDFCTTLGEVLDSPAWLPVPEFSLRLALGEMADLVVKGQCVLPARAQALGYSFKYSHLKPALQDLLG